MASPKVQTVKRLFAVSGNRCAYPGCSNPLIDPQSNSVIGEICHIKGSRPGSKRHDPTQSDAKRHGFENLLLLCNGHHKVVDDDEIAYTVARLIEMKSSHEQRHTAPPQVDDSTVKQFAAIAIRNSEITGSVLSTHGQTGGQAAHLINNYYTQDSTHETVQIDGKLEMAGELNYFQNFGCPGMRLTVVCRSKRPAKIGTAHLLVAGDDFMKGFQQGFGTDFGYTKVAGSRQILDVELHPLSQPNSQEGYVLDRDDVCRFFFPLTWPPTTVALRAKPEDISITLKHFDGSEHTLLSGKDVQSVLAGVFEVFKQQPGQLRVRMNLSVRVTSSTKPTVDMMGKCNSNHAPIVQPTGQEEQDAARGTATAGKKPREQAAQSAKRPKKLKTRPKKS